MKKWSELMVWQKHVIVLFSILIFGFLILKSMVSLNILTGNDQVSWNVILNASALGYAIWAFKTFDEDVGKINKKIKEMGIKPSNVNGLVMYITSEIKPILDSIKEVGITKKDMNNFLMLIKKIDPEMLKDLGEYLKYEKTKIKIPDLDFDDEVEEVKTYTLTNETKKESGKE